MKKLLILSGKGGTGKTTTASAFIYLANARAFADVDVEVPNLHLVLKLPDTDQCQTIDYFGSHKSFINESFCINCGLCYEHCRFGAILKKDNHFSIDPYACEGCGVCQIVCKQKAISLQEDKAGEIFLFNKSELATQSTLSMENKTSTALFVTAKLKMGRGNSGKLVSEVKKNLFNKAPDTNFAIIDGSPGIGCPVIASINGVDLVLLVVEPSLSGMSDMKRLLKTLEILRTKAIVCINKFDTNIEKTNEIIDYCEENSIFVTGKIPYDTNVSLAINTGRSIVEIDCPASYAMQEVFAKTCKQLDLNLKLFNN